ncbi:MAG: sigma-70 family RNA polymerase sigma factor [Deltaproteobacteria bacterium]|nr:sigma-70 family RNA polymerase sigma factor [Deltaproteobacteria bacterium]
MLRTRVPVEIGRRQRDALILRHVGAARRIALSVVRGADGARRDDAIAAGLLGLTEAADRYDPGRGEPFVAFAEKRIRGAVVDELRRGDVLPRRLRRQVRRAAQARRALEQQGTVATDAAIAQALGVDERAYRDRIAPYTAITVESLDDATASRHAAVQPSPAEAAETREAMTRITSVVATFAARDVEILQLHYRDDLPYRTIGRRLGLTASRISQLHGRALARMRVCAA